MDPFLTDLSDTTLAAAAKANLRGVVRRLAHSPLAHAERGPGWLRYRTGIPHPWFSGLLVGDAGPEPLLADTVAALADAAPLWSVWFPGDAAPPPWDDALAAAGMRRDDGIPEMAVAIGDLPWDDPLPAGVAIETVTDPDTLRLWTRTMIAGFDMPPELADPFAALCESLADAPTIRYLLARRDGVPVATSGSIVDGGVVGIYYVATLPEARGCGIGAAVTREAVRDARDAGCRAAILQASPMGEPVYRRLGFRTVGTAVHHTWPLEVSPP